MDIKNKVSSKMRLLIELLSTTKLIVLTFPIIPNIALCVQKEKLNPKTPQLIFQERRRLQAVEEGAVFRKRQPFKITIAPILPEPPSKLPTKKYQETPTQIQSVAVPEIKNFRRLIMILDPIMSDKDIESALSLDLLDSLSQEASPVLVSINIFNTVIKELAYVYQSKRKLKKYAFCQKKSVGKIDQCLVSESEKTKIEFMLSQVKFNSDKWHVYYNKQVKLILLLPKEYIKKITPEEITDQNKASIFSILGFKSYDFVELILPKPNSPDIPAKLEDMLKKIYGIYNINDPSVDMKEDGKKIVDNLDNIFQIHSKDKYLDYYWNIYATGHGGKYTGGIFIINLEISNFIRFLEFMNNSINTNIFYYNTCYGGSLAAIIDPYQKIRSALNYTIVSQTTTDLPSISVASRNWKQINGMKLRPVNNFIQFFDAMEKGEPITKILSIAIGEAIDAGYSANTPIVRFPGTEWFTSKWKTPGKQKLETVGIKDSLRDDVVTIGKIDNLKHTAENKPFEINNKKVIIVTQDIITVPLVISHDFFGITTIIKSPPTKIDFSNREYLHNFGMSSNEIKKFKRKLLRKRHYLPQLYFKEITIKNLESLFQIVQYNTIPGKNIIFYFEKINLTDPEANLPKGFAMSKKKSLKHVILSLKQEDVLLQKTEEEKESEEEKIMKAEEDIEESENPAAEISISVRGKGKFTAIVEESTPQIAMHDIFPDVNLEIPENITEIMFKYLEVEAKEIEKKAEVFKKLERK